MKENFERLVDEAIQLELNVAELYLLFYRLFPGDSKFWWQLAIEEQNHAALLKTVRQMTKSNLSIPEEIVPESFEELKKSNLKISVAIETFKKEPNRKRAFHFAYEIETSAGELHYESFMKYGADSRLKSVFLRLNGDDINHASRIKDYMTENQISGMA